MNKLIIITGDLASGKSTLANSLSSQLSIPAFIKDNFKELLCDVFDYSNREENRKLSIGAVNSMIHVFSQIAKVNDDVILEGNFRLEELRKIEEIANQNEYQICCINLYGDSKVLYQRFLDRLTNRHKAHMSLGLNRGIEYYDEYINSLRDSIVSYPMNKIDMTELNEMDVVDKALDILSKEGII